MENSKQSAEQPPRVGMGILGRQSFLELDARARCHAILDKDTGRELCGPFDRVESPWLEPQGLVPQADDGVVVVKGALDGEPCVVLGVEGRFRAVVSVRCRGPR